MGTKLPFSRVPPKSGPIAADTSPMKNQTGFSLIELIVTLAVVALTMTMVVPGVQQFMQSNRLVSQLNMLSSSLAAARSEAVKRNLRAVACPTTDGTSCNTANGAGWETGWLVFLDRNNNFALNEVAGSCAEAATSGDCLLMSQQALTGGTTLRAASGIVGALGYDGTGGVFCKNGTGSAQACAAASTFFTICDARGASGARGLAISNTGRASVIDKQPDASSLSCP